MNYELFIARRILFDPQASRTISRPIVRIAIGGVALGLAVIILSVFIVTGFRNEIRDKVIGFGGHIQISKFDTNDSYEASPIAKDQSFLPRLKALDNMDHVQAFAIKAGIIKTDNEIEGVLLKGVGSDFDWSFFQRNLVNGSVFAISDSVKTKKLLISKHIAGRLKLKVGDKLVMFFIQEQQQRARDFIVEGIYQTGLEEFDHLFVIGDIGHVQKLNDWNSSQVNGFELTLKNFKKLDETGEKVNKVIGFDLKAQTIKELQPQIFDWLGLHDVNVAIIIVIMLFVAGINMISALLIIILERTSTIGILKSVGAPDIAIRKIFLYVAAWLVSAGLIIGNGIALILSFIQTQWHVFTLPAETYYISYVPIHFSWTNLLFLNAGTLVVCMLMLFIPTVIINRIRPVKAIKFA